MRKILTTAVAAVTFAGAVAATATPAQAERYRHHNRHSGGDKAAVAAIAGIAGLAIGAALSSKGDGRSQYSSSYGYRDAPYRNGYAYDPRYDSYNGDYYAYAPPPRVCTSRERVYDRYTGRRVIIEHRYRC